MLEIKDLEELTCILDTVVFEEYEEPSIFTEEYAIELVETALYLMDDYITHHPTAISEPNFHEILLEDMSIKEANVVKIENDFIFIIDKWENFNLEISDEMVIYGKQVDDFQLVDKTKLAMLGLAGTKELHQIVKQQQSQINTQQKTIETLTDHLTKLTEQVNLLTKILSPV
jgi:alkyl sulfatase BDS1-like metallo-beta-lactamase superfamily hydrolase